MQEKYCQSGSVRALGLTAVVISCLFLFPLALTSRAHDPITTKVRFNKEVVRVLQRSCLGCHRPGGIVMSLATYDEARPWAKAIKEEVLEKRMPPWHAAKGYGEFRNAPPLTQHDKDLIVNWVEGGAPKGDDKDLPEGPVFSTDWQLGKPDLTLKPAAETSIGAGVDQVHTFILSTNLKSDRWLTAIDLQPSNAAVVHCARFYILKNRDDEDPPAMDVKGEDPVKSEIRNTPVSATWIPGQRAVTPDPGVAQLLGAGSRIAVSIHYHGSDEDATDLSAVGLYFAKSPPSKQIRFVPLTGPDSAIQPGNEPQSARVSLTISKDTEVVGIRPSVHPLMISLQATAYRPDGSQQVLIWNRGYQFDWAPTYFLKQMAALPKGTKIEAIAYFDNSDNNPNNPNNPAKPVRWSEITDEPWCVLLLTDPVR